MNDNIISIIDYLDKKGIQYIESNGELIAKCIFNSCDDDSHTNESHLYLNKETGQYQCKKCLSEGNIFTLAKFFQDDISSLFIKPKSTRNPIFHEDLVKKCHEDLPQRIKDYLIKERKLHPDIIEEYQIGYGYFYNKYWITIPIKDKDGNYSYFKLRDDPEVGKDKRTYPKSSSTKSVEAQMYGRENIFIAKDFGYLLICEGELDCLASLSQGIPTITSTHGAGTFKDEWVKDLLDTPKIYVCFDNDDAGRTGAERVLKKLYESGHKNLRNVKLPEEVGEKGDITDYVKLGGSIEGLLTNNSVIYPPQIDTSKFAEFGVNEVKQVLDSTIKGDNENKIIALLAGITNYTEDSQYNVSFTGPSSSGKTYIVEEVLKYFPKQDILDLGHASPKAFFHTNGEYNKDENSITVDLSKKIIFFMDQPSSDLLSNLRPILSHDKKEINILVSDKNKVGSNQTKRVIMRGYPTVYFCTANLRMDEQESSRFFTLSPDTNSTKINQSLKQSVNTVSSESDFYNEIENNTDRNLLKERVLAVKHSGIKFVKITDADLVRQKLLQRRSNEDDRKTTDQRNIKKLFNLVKSFALLNFHLRERKEDTLFANQFDIDNAFKLWDEIYIYQELGISKHIFEIYKNIIVPIYEKKIEDIKSDPDFNIMHDFDKQKIENAGVNDSEILIGYNRTFKTALNPTKWRMEIRPMMEAAGLITLGDDFNDTRRRVVVPVLDLDTIR